MKQSVVGYQWTNQQWGTWFYSSLETYQPPGKEGNLEIHLRNADETVLPWVVEMACDDIKQVKLGKRSQQWVTLNDRSVERLQILPSLLDLIRSMPRTDNMNVAQFDEAGEILGIWGEAVFNGLKKDADNIPQGMLFAYQRSVKSEQTSKSPEAIAEDLKTQLASLAEQLADLSEPLWRAKGPVGIGGAGKMARPYLPKVFAVMANFQDNDKILDQYFQFLEGNVSPDLDEVRPFLDSPNRVVAVAALASVKWKIPRQDLLARLKILSHPGEQSKIQREIEFRISNGGVKN